jgi:ribosomal protein L7Ae-like RNA K-turn-binding protein
VPDIRGALPGRGFWVEAERETLVLALKKGAFARAARAPLTIPSDLPGMVEGLLLRQTQSLLGMAFKAGQVVAGFAKVERLLTAGKAHALLEAADAGPHGAAKLRGQARAMAVPVLVILSGAEMGLALGRENMVHAGLTAEGLARRFLDEARRLSGFRKEANLVAALPISS